VQHQITALDRQHQSRPGLGAVLEQQRAVNRLDVDAASLFGFDAIGDLGQLALLDLYGAASPRTSPLPPPACAT
jgi:hypothetical protein